MVQDLYNRRYNHKQVVNDVQFVQPQYNPNPQMMPDPMMAAAARGGGEEQPEEEMVTESPEVPDLEAPDMTNYGMEEESEKSWLDYIVAEAKAPLVVIILAFIMTVPQVNSLVRNTLGRLTGNMLYINILQALLIGLIFYGVMKLLV